MHFKAKIACLLDDLFQLIISLRKNEYLERNGQLPESMNELSDLLTVLNESGEVLFLKTDKDIGKSWIVLTKGALLMELYLLLKSLRSIVKSQTLLGSFHYLILGDFPSL